MSRGFLVLAQNSVNKDFNIKPVHYLNEEYTGVFVDVWYKELAHTKGQHVYYNGTVYKVKETCLPNTDFDKSKYEILVKDVRLIDDKNKQLEFHRAFKDDIVLDNNKLYSVQKVDDEVDYALTPIHEDKHIDIWYKDTEYEKGSFVWCNNTVYELLESVKGDTALSQVHKKVAHENILLYADNNKSLFFSDPRKSATVLYYNKLNILTPVCVENYVQQACLLASTLKKHCPEEKISIVTNDEVPPKQKKLFDRIIPIPFGDDATESAWKVENRWKLYHCSPYEKTIVMDSDMIILEDITRWWKYLEKYKLFFTSNVQTYRQETVQDNYYRKTFIKNNLPNIYTGLHYFEKSELPERFYNYLETVCKNWEEFYSKFLPNNTPPRLSIDVASALVVKILDIENQVTSTNSNVTFTHMKSFVQNWRSPTESWQQSVSVYIPENLQLKIGNYVQRGVLHYTENSFVNNSGIENLYG